MNIDGVTTGIVLDHIQAGKSMDIYRLLKLNEIDNSVAVIQNARSTKYGRKDIIKIDQEIELDMDAIGYVDPNITVNIIRDGRLEKKEHLELPEMLTDVIRCKNPRCITTVEQEAVQRFYLADRGKKIYRCVYCDVEHSE